MSVFSDVLAAKRQVSTKRAEEASRIEFWRDIGLHVEDSTSFSKEDAGVDTEKNLFATSDFVERGIGVFREVFSENAVAAALKVVHLVDQAEWPLVFAFLDDRLWHLLREEHLRNLLTPLLGEAPQQMPGIWVHHVARGNTGWEPHVDVSGPPVPVQKGVDRITAWLPLTEATHQNGCIFSVPYSHLNPLMHRFDSADQVALDDVIRLFHKAEVMEATPGDLLLWRFQTLHWGGPSSKDAPQERLSLSLEFGHSDVPAHQDAQPMWPLGAIPSFRTRLFLIGRSLLMYGKSSEREPVASLFLDVGSALAEMHSA